MKTKTLVSALKSLSTYRINQFRIEIDGENLMVISLHSAGGDSSTFYNTECIAVCESLNVSCFLQINADGNVEMVAHGLK